MIYIDYVIFLGNRFLCRILRFPLEKFYLANAKEEMLLKGKKDSIQFLNQEPKGVLRIRNLNTKNDLDTPSKSMPENDKTQNCI